MSEDRLKVTDLNTSRLVTDDNLSGLERRFLRHFGVFAWYKGIN